jgi:hypothetical protein
VASKPGPLLLSGEREERDGRRRAAQLNVHARRERIGRDLRRPVTSPVRRSRNSILTMLRSTPMSIGSLQMPSTYPLHCIGDDIVDLTASRSTSAAGTLQFDGLGLAARDHDQTTSPCTVRDVIGAHQTRGGPRRAGAARTRLV